MESIFEHNITEKEFKDLFPSYKTKEDYIFYTNSFTRTLDIYRLYKNRGDDCNAQLYLNKTRETLHSNYTF